MNRAKILNHLFWEVLDYPEPPSERFRKTEDGFKCPSVAYWVERSVERRELEGWASALWSPSDWTYGETFLLAVLKDTYCVNEHDGSGAYQFLIDQMTSSEKKKALKWIL